MVNTAVEFKHVKKNYGSTTIIPDLSFEINKGEFITILGSSGSGKTTILKMINGLQSANSGTIIVNGENIKETDIVSLRRKIGYVVQQICLFPHMSIMENIATVPKLLGWDQDKINMRVNKLLTLVKLNPETYKNRYPNQLSGGQQQRVGVARALAANPDYILFDEPFGALDAITRRELQEELKKIHQQLKNKTFIFVTHDIKEAFYLGQRIMIVHDGKIEQFDEPNKIILQPKTEFIKKLLETVKQEYRLWDEVK